MTAIELAQSQIGQDQALDQNLCDRHSLTGDKCSVAGSANVGAWVVLQQEFEVPEQQLRPGLAVHGILDYVIGVVRADKGVC
jgi:hypothetical protein